MLHCRVVAFNYAVFVTAKLQITVVDPRIAFVCGEAGNCVFSDGANCAVGLRMTPRILG